MKRTTTAIIVLTCVGALATGVLTFLAHDEGGAISGGVVAIAAGLSGGIFASVFMLLSTVFSQGGEVRMSAQRESALATGHTDRTTLFEQPLLKPLTWLLLVICHRLAMPKFKEWLRRTLVAAGSPNFYTPEEYLALSLLAGLGLAGVLLVGKLMISSEVSLLAVVVGLVGGTGISIYNMHETAAQRIRRIAKRVPYALDLISLAMGAGATFTEAVGTVVRERSDDPFHVELRTLLAEMELGATRRKALSNLSDRIPLDSLRCIIASVVQAEELGTPLGQVLHDQATLMRMNRSTRAEEAAAAASVRILVPCLILVMAVMLVVFGPFIVKYSQGGLF